MTSKFPYNLRKCTSANSLSACIHRYLSKTIILLPTQVEYVGIFEKTLIGGFNCVNTRLAFDSLILFPWDPDGNRKQNLKLICKILKHTFTKTKGLSPKYLKWTRMTNTTMPWQSPFQQAALKGWKKIPTHREILTRKVSATCSLLILSLTEKTRLKKLFCLMKSTRIFLRKKCSFAQQVIRISTSCRDEIER